MVDMSRTKVIPKNVDWGMYVYMNADGTTLSDSEGRVLAMEGFKNDPEAIKKMKVAGAHYGSLGGKVAFLPGSRAVSDSEWEDQMEALLDERDIPGDIDA